ncbi:MAG: CPBP family intramembrane metalloprotease [Oscillospiraceae bacterium]|nr:CPBP family intramembrane metalloprotease [Oscillospiraceae bacterium]
MKVLSKPLVTALIVFLVLFYAAWTAVECLLCPMLAVRLGEDPVPMYLVRDLVLKNLLWTLPAFLLIGRFDKTLTIRRREMLTHPVRVGETIALFAAFLGYILLTAWRAGGGLHVYGEHLPECLAFITVGLTEEAVFRGWILNALLPLGKWQALAVSSVLFLFIHFPIWIMHGTFVSAFTGLGFLTILALGFLFGLVFLRWRNLWIPIAMHMLWDIGVTVLYP